MTDFKPTLPKFRNSKKINLLKQSALSQFIYQLGESPILQKPTRKILLKEIKTNLFKSKVNYLKKCLTKYRKITGLGRGIAAPQVGIPESFALIFNQDNFLVIINPKIIKSSSQSYLYPEICMSAFPVIAPIIRPTWVEIEYLDESGKKQNWTIKDNTKQGKTLNRVFQHEIDHLSGIINIELVKPPQKLSLLSDPNFFSKTKFFKMKT